MTRIVCAGPIRVTRQWVDEDGREPAVLLSVVGEGPSEAFTGALQHLVAAGDLDGRTTVVLDVSRWRMFVTLPGVRANTRLLSSGPNRPIRLFYVTPDAGFLSLVRFVQAVCEAEGLCLDVRLFPSVPEALRARVHTDGNPDGPTVERAALQRDGPLHANPVDRVRGVSHARDSL